MIQYSAISNNTGSSSFCSLKVSDQVFYEIVESHPIFSKSLLDLDVTVRIQFKEDINNSDKDRGDLKT